jgi:hypothetical protein
MMLNYVWWWPFPKPAGKTNCSWKLRFQIWLETLIVSRNEHHLEMAENTDQL